MGTSIYDLISENLNDDGRLPAGFELPQAEVAPNELKFMVGARDGIGFYHLNDKESDKIAGRIFGYLKARKTEKITPLLKKYDVITFTDSLIKEIKQRHNELDTGLIIEFAISLAFESDDVEQVKLGISLLGLFNWSDYDEMQKKLFTLAMYEEFTLFVVYVAQAWENGNDVIYRIAKNVDGWGKISAVERLEPETDEIREWILRHGCENKVLDGYLGLECAVKGDLIAALRRDELDDELFDSICIIMDALADEGPADGMSVYEYTEEAFYRFLIFSKKYATNLRHLWHILSIEDGLEKLENAELNNKNELLQMISDIKDEPVWIYKITEKISVPKDDDFFYAYNTARRLNRKIDVTEYAYKAIEQDPIELYYCIPNIMQHPEYVKKLVALYENIIPHEEMATGMGDYVFSPTFAGEHNCLGFILQDLGQYPLLGGRLVQTGLLSPVIRDRNMACKAMKGWSEKLNKPIAEISPELFDILVMVASTEINDDTKKTMEELINP